MILSNFRQARLDLYVLYHMPMVLTYRASISCFTIPLIVMLLCLGCGAALPAKSQQARLQQARTAVLPVLDGLPTALPADAGIPGARSRAKQVSSPGLYTLAVPGIDRFTVAGDVSDAGQASHFVSGNTGELAVSWAIYRLPLWGLPADDLNISLSSLARQGGGQGEAWVGLANYAKGYWEWSGPYTGEAISFPSLTADYYSCPGNTYVAVVAFDGSSFDCESLNVDVAGLTVGPGRDFAAIEDAYAAAADDDRILVFPEDAGAPYVHPVLQVHKPGLAFYGVRPVDGALVKLDGTGFNYNGAGPVPRAIFQFNPDASGGLVSGFELYNATNDSYNGAGVRINQANNVTVRYCEIHDCDMGMMSNGSLSAGTGAGQLIEKCYIHNNGSLLDPGYNHNLYMGGIDVTLRACEVSNSLTGHNFKSRAHFNRLEYCYIHDSLNRELDLVDDAENTAAAGSDSVVVGCIIIKSPDSDNHATIHFGRDVGGEHNGTLWLVNDTVMTPFVSAVVTLSAPGAGAVFANDIFWNGGTDQSNQQLVAASNGASLGNASGGHLWFSFGMGVAGGTAIDLGSIYTAPQGTDPPFAGAQSADERLRDYHLAAADPQLVDMGLAWDTLGIPGGPGLPALSGLPYQYHIPTCLEPRRDAGLPDLGAYGFP